MDRLAELRERRALTLRELSEMGGVAADTINQIELGHRKARPSTLRKLAKALDVDVRELFEEPALSGKAEAPEAGRPKVQASPRLEEEPERRNPEPSDAQRRFAKVDEMATEYLVGRAEKHDAEVMDPNSPHFANATVAALWLAGVEDERTAWLDWLRDLWEITMPSGDLGAGMKQVVGRWLLALGAVLAFDQLTNRAEERIRAMNDRPDELAARRLEVAHAAGKASKKRLEDQREAAGG